MSEVSRVIARNQLIYNIVVIQFVSASIWTNTAVFLYIKKTGATTITKFAERSTVLLILVTNLNIQHIQHLCAQITESFSQLNSLQRNYLFLKLRTIICDILHMERDWNSYQRRPRQYYTHTSRNQNPLALQIKRQILNTVENFYKELDAKFRSGGCGLIRKSEVLLMFKQQEKHNWDQYLRFYSEDKLMTVIFTRFGELHRSTPDMLRATAGCKNWLLWKQPVPVEVEKEVKVLLQSTQVVHNTNKVKSDLVTVSNYVESFKHMLCLEETAQQEKAKQSQVIAVMTHLSNKCFELSEVEALLMHANVQRGNKVIISSSDSNNCIEATIVKIHVKDSSETVLTVHLQDDFGFKQFQRVKAYLQYNKIKFSRMNVALNLLQDNNNQVLKLIKSGDPLMLQQLSTEPFWQNSVDWVTKQLNSNSLTVHLDESQRQAIIAAFSRPLHIITGAPGTGKTTLALTVIALWIKEYTLNQNDCKYLITAPNNSVVDELLSKTLTLWPELKDKILRVPSETWLECDLKARPEKGDILEMCLQLKEKNMNGKTIDIVDKHTFFFVTCTQCKCKALQQVNFRKVVVDEASLAIEPDLLCALVSNTLQHVILIGDHRQVSPSVTSAEASSKGLRISLMERLIGSKFPYNQLALQYRSATNLTWFTQRFYSHYTSAPTVSSIAPYPLPGLKAHSSIFLQVSSPEFKDTKFYTSNSGQTFEVVRLLWALLCTKHMSASDIVVLSVYSEQVTQIQSELILYQVELEDKSNYKKDVIKKREFVRKWRVDPRELLQVEVTTVDSFQGKEKPLVIFVTSRSNQSGIIGSTSDTHTLNIAMSRAIRGRIIIGDAFTLIKSKSADWHDIIQWHLERNAFFVGEDYRTHDAFSEKMDFTKNS